MVAEEIGRTKPSRAPERWVKRQKTSDSRPPDTSRELVGKKARLPRLYRAYPWSSNSCWLDTALELVFAVFCRNHGDFTNRFSSVSDKMAFPLWRLHELLNSRKAQHGELGNSADAAGRLLLERDGFRSFLFEQKIINSMHDMETLSVSLKTIWTGRLSY